MRYTREWLRATIIRAIRTMAQTAVGVFTIGMTIRDIDWWYVVSISVVSAVYSILTSIATDLPEASNK